MATLIKDLNKLKEKINLLIYQKISITEFDKWIVTQIIKENIDDYYQDLILEMGTKLELLKVKFLNSVNWNKVSKLDYNKIDYPKEYLNKMLDKIERKIKNIKQ